MIVRAQLQYHTYTCTRKRRNIAYYACARARVAMVRARAVVCTDARELQNREIQQRIVVFLRLLCYFSVNQDENRSNIVLCPSEKKGYKA